MNEGWIENDGIIGTDSGVGSEEELVDMQQLVVREHHRIKLRPWFEQVWGKVRQPVVRDVEVRHSFRSYVDISRHVSCGQGGNSILNSSLKLQNHRNQLGLKNVNVLVVENQRKIICRMILSVFESSRIITCVQVQVKAA
ncbi:hypothetical protein CEXT_243831 [Caerostris extrusa]|uniref:Uncharacterized protein n=1 Tax=Caerostris extrusa TaxID=172846 RepID=A0AAV4TAV8_CAEEX|nr:hypothetical protein CEXT_243831 [Caerostris extrusa]